MSMRLQFLLLPALAGSIAVATVAQTPPAGTPAPPPAEGQGLSDLTNTVQGLEDQTRPAPVARTPAPTPTPPRAPPAANTPPLTTAQVAAINRAALRGRVLVAITRAGMIATQDMLSRVTDPEAAGIDGWIVESEGAAMVVAFFDNANDGPKTVYRATVLGGRVTSRDTFLGTFRPPLSRGQARLAAARTAVAATEAQACSPSGFNYLVVPPATATGAIDVYRISAPAARGRIPAGGHYRVSVSGNGQPGENHAFATACADIEVTEPPAGQQPRPIQIAASPDDVPTEVHVLLSQMSGRALLFTAGTPPRQWLVAGDRIGEIRDGAPRFVTSQD